MAKVKEGNFQNEKGRGGILLFIGNKVQHSKQWDQPEQATWHVSKDKKPHTKNNKIIINK